MTFIIGTCVLELFISDSHSLKDRRQVLNSLLDRLHDRFNVSAAQLDQHNSWTQATLGVACVGNETRHVNTVLNKVLEFVEREPRVVVGGVNMEML